MTRPRPWHDIFGSNRRVHECAALIDGELRSPRREGPRSRYSTAWQRPPIRLTLLHTAFGLLTDQSVESPQGPRRSLMRVYWRPSFKHRAYQPILHARGLWELTAPATELSAIEALSGPMPARTPSSRSSDVLTLPGTLKALGLQLMNPTLSPSLRCTVVRGINKTPMLCTLRGPLF